MRDNLLGILNPKQQQTRNLYYLRVLYLRCLFSIPSVFLTNIDLQNDLFYILWQHGILFKSQYTRTNDHLKKNVYVHNVMQFWIVCFRCILKCKVKLINIACVFKRLHISLKVVHVSRNELHVFLLLFYWAYWTTAKSWIYIHCTSLNTPYDTVTFWV